MYAKASGSFLSGLPDSPVPLTRPYFLVPPTIIKASVPILTPFLFITQCGFAFLVEPLLVMRDSSEDTGLAYGRD